MIRADHLTLARLLLLPIPIAMLYQESAARQTLDKSITILQGRCVGGGTTINWTSSFRTPRRTLAHWRDVHGLAGLTEEALDPWFARMESRLGIGPWSVPPNGNNDALRRGAAKLGFARAVVPARNAERLARPPAIELCPVSTLREALAACDLERA